MIPLAATTPAVDGAGELVSYLLSAAVMAALVTGLFNWINNKRNARIAERKNTADEDNDLVARYQAMATEERAGKESAVKTVTELLGIAETQIQTLKGTVAQLSATIETLQRSAESQHDLIEDIRRERDRLTAALALSQQRVDEQRAELLAKQAEILSLSAVNLITQTEGEH